MYLQVKNLRFLIIYNQIANNEVVTITHRRMTRYFLTSNEACKLIILASSFKKICRYFIIYDGKTTKE